MTIDYRERYGWDGIRESFIATHIPRLDQQRLRLSFFEDQETARILAGLPKEGTTKIQPIERIVAGQIGWGEDPAVAFSKVALPVIQRAAFPHQFYVECRTNNPHYSMLADIALSGRVEAYSKTIATYTDRLFTMIRGETVDLHADLDSFRNFICRHGALQTATGAIRWVDWLIERGDTDILKRIGITHGVIYRRDQEVIPNTTSLSERTVALISASTGIPFSDDLRDRLKQCFEAHEQARLDAMYYTTSPILIGSKPYWNKHATSFLSTVALFQEAPPHGIKNSAALFEALVDSEEQEPTTDYTKGAEALHALYSVCGLFEGEIASREYADVFRLLKKSPPHIVTKTIELLTQLQPIMGDAIRSDLAPLMAFCQAHPDLAIDTEAFSSFYKWATTFTNEEITPTEILHAFLETTKDIREKAQNLLNLAFLEEKTVPIITLFLFIIEVCKQGLEGDFLESLFTEMGTSLKAADIVGILRTSHFKNASPEQKESLAQCLAELSIPADSHPRILFHLLGHPDAEARLCNMHALLKKIEALIKHPLEQDLAINALADSLRYKEQMFNALARYEEARGALFDHCDDFLLNTDPLDKAIGAFLESFGDDTPRWATQVTSVGLSGVTFINSQALHEYIPLTFPEGLSDLTFTHPDRTHLYQMSPLGLGKGMRIYRSWSEENGYPIFSISITDSNSERRSMHIPLAISRETLEAEPELAPLVSGIGRTALDEHKRSKRDSVTTFDELCEAHELEFSWTGSIPQTVVKAALFEFYKAVRTGVRKAVWELAGEKTFYPEPRLGDGHCYKVEDTFSLLPNDSSEAHTVTTTPQYDVTVQTPEGEEKLYTVKRTKSREKITLSMNTDECGTLSVTVEYSDSFTFDTTNRALQLLSLKGIYYRKTGR